MHVQAHRALGEMIAESGIETRMVYKVLDMGGRDVNSTVQGLDVRPYLPHSVWQGADLAAGPGVDIVTDLTRRPWTYADDYDVVVSTELLEHVADWKAVLLNAAEALTHGYDPHVFITCAGPGRPAHGASGADRPAPGEWYANVAPQELEAALKDVFDDVHVRFGPETCDTYGWARGLK